MRDLIDRKQAIKEISDRYKEAVDWLIETIQELPSAEQKTAKWYIVTEPIKGNGLYECSECCCVEFEKTDYCPNCGAKMEAEE